VSDWLNQTPFLPSSANGAYRGIARHTGYHVDAHLNDASMILLNLIISLLAATACYAASPNQKLWRHVTSAKALLIIGLLLQLLALIAWIALLGVASGIFTALSLAMFAFVLLPVLAAMRWPRAAR
jgi:hypothetical protein